MGFRIEEQQPERSRRLSIMVLLSCLLLPSGLLAAVLLQPWAEPKWMFLDPLTAAKYAETCCSVYYGSVSNAGILLWSITTAFCLFAVLLLWGVDGFGPLRRFGLTAGLLTGWVTLDDMFMLHERVLPTLGIPQIVVIGLYLGLGLAYLLANWRFIWFQDWWLLALAGAGLVASIAVDTIFHSLDPVLVYIEDSAKFFGIFCWAMFHGYTLFAHMRILIRRSAT